MHPLVGCSESHERSSLLDCVLDSRFVTPVHVVSSCIVPLSSGMNIASPLPEYDIVTTCILHCVAGDSLGQARRLAHLSGRGQNFVTIPKRGDMVGLQE